MIKDVTELLHEVWDKIEQPLHLKISKLPSVRGIEELVVLDSDCNNETLNSILEAGRVIKCVKEALKKRGLPLGH